MQWYTQLHHFNGLPYPEDAVVSMTAGLMFIFMDASPKAEHQDQAKKRDFDLIEVMCGTNQAFSPKTGIQENGTGCQNEGTFSPIAEPASIKVVRMDKSTTLHYTGCEGQLYC